MGSITPITPIQYFASVFAHASCCYKMSFSKRKKKNNDLSELLFTKLNPGIVPLSTAHKTRVRWHSSKQTVTIGCLVTLLRFRTKGACSLRTRIICGQASSASLSADSFCTTNKKHASDLVRTLSFAACIRTVTTAGKHPAEPPRSRLHAYTLHLPFIHCDAPARSPAKP